MNNSIIVTNIQRMCFHDGPGIRTTVFLKGCSIHCPWCSNPENISFTLQDYCLDGKKGIYGKIYTCEQLLEILLKDKVFWRVDGGVTFSGGEALMQAKELKRLFSMLKQEHVNIAVETSLFIPNSYLDMILNDIDFFLIDVKILEKSLCREILGGDLRLYLLNVDQVYQSGKKMIFRVPCNYEFTFSEENKKNLLSFFLKYKDIHVQIFGIHDLGKNKYESLSLLPWKHKEMCDDDLNEFCKQLKENGIIAEMLHI